jgi:hypothetical protein
MGPHASFPRRSFVRHPVGRKDFALDDTRQSWLAWHGSSSASPSREMPGALSRYLIEDHARLHRLLAAAIANPDHFDCDAFEQFRAGILRHIGIEEKILLPDARRRRDGEPLPIGETLRAEHAALASLLVPTPDPALAREIEALLRRHDAREEGPGGLYELCETLAGDDEELLLARARAASPPPLARHFDGQGTMRTAAEALRAAEHIRLKRHAQ